MVEWLHGEILFDPCPLVGQIPPALLEAVLAQVTWISLNAREAIVLTGEADPRAVLARGPRLRGAIVRDGADGCRLATADGVEHIPALLPRWSTRPARATPTSARSPPRSPAASHPPARACTATRWRPWSWPTGAP